MKGTLAVFGEMAGHGASARIVDGQLDDLLIDPPETCMRPGAIYRAKAGRLMKGQGGMILETPDGPLFLRQAKGIGAGETLLVQVTTHAEDGKANPCTTRLLFKSRFAMVTPGAAGKNISKAIRDEERRVELRDLLEGLDVPDGVGLVLRTAAEEADDDVVADDARAMLDLATAILCEDAGGPPEKLLEGPSSEEIAFRDWPTPDSTESGPEAFAETGVLDLVDALGSPRKMLANGAYMFIEPTRALVSVDINTGPDTTPAASLKANIDAVRALPRELRIRGLGGQIVIDPAPLSKRDRKQIESVFKTAFRNDPIETTLVGWTPLGHLELIRKRERLPLTECLK
ncbi:MAG: ribonuclease E/G [Paracoccaceae bacterium]|nr:ribonuclease E/G [Paracoccaceae bacterium]